MGAVRTPVVRVGPEGGFNGPHSARKDSGHDIMLLLDQQWSQSLPGSPASSLGSDGSLVDFNSVLGSDGPSSPPRQQGLYIPAPAFRKVHRLSVLHDDGPVAAPAFMGTPAVSPAWERGSPLPAGATKPVPIPAARGPARWQAAPAAAAKKPESPRLEGMHNSVAARGRAVGAGHAAVAPDTPGSWAQRQVKHAVKPQGAVMLDRSPDSVLPARYGFVPDGAVALAPGPPAVPAFWPESKTAGKGPHAAAAAHALHAAAQKPPTRVLFKAAARVLAPERPAAAMQATALAKRPPSQEGQAPTDELSIEEKLWRLRTKRAWIKEQLRAQRGFWGTSDNASYAEPWAEAFDLLRAMGGAPDLQTAQHPSSSINTDCSGSLLELQEDTLFDIAEDAPTAEGRMHKAGSHASSAQSSKSRLRSTPSIHSPVAGPAANSPHGLLAAAKTSHGSGQSPATAVHGSRKPAATIIERAQELVRCQRSIELDTAREWRAKELSSKAQGAAGRQRWLLRTDSAFEVHKYA